MPALVTGNKTSDKATRGADFYPTPYAALPPLLMAEKRRLPKVLWEPACGNGALVVPLRNRGFSVTASDLIGWGCPDSMALVDFLEPAAADFAPAHPYGIVTNPPFGIIEPFIEQAARLADYIAVLCRLAFFESEGRMMWWKKVGLRRVLIIPERLPMFHRHGYEGPKLDKAAMCFAWFIFEPRRPAPRAVSVRWISWKAAAKRHPQRPEDVPPEADQEFPLFKAFA